jgi:hypothetical protein
MIVCWFFRALSQSLLSLFTHILRECIISMALNIICMSTVLTLTCVIKT